MNRAQLRGKKLDKDCYRAKTTTHEYGACDNRVFCYGFNDASTDELMDKCKYCNANVINIDLHKF